MANGFSGTVLPQIHRIFHGGTVAGMSDAELLDRFVTARDPEAFEALIARHGSLVLRVCRSLLRNPDDVEDAFQATLLVLVRKARSITVESSLAPWLHAVASRVATRARSSAALREARERHAERIQPAAPARDLDRHDVPPILHEELGLLPERLRAPIVLCHLEGLTHDQAAQQLGWPVGTVRSRLARGRSLLRGRLSRRGVTVSAVTLGACARPAAEAAVPRFLLQSTVEAAMRVAAGRAAMRGAVSAPVAALVKGVVSAMWLSKLKAAAAASIVAVIVTAAVAHAVQARDENDDEAAIPQAGPRPVGPVEPAARRASPRDTFFKTYYVGDLFVASRRRTSPRDGSATEAQGPRVDMQPVIDLLTSTVAPGTWRILDQDGTPMRGGQAVHDGQVGSITPFFLSLSLIVRHTPQAHDEIATRLRQVRRIQDVIIDRGAPPEHPEPRPAQPGPPAGATPGGERARELLDALQQEVDRLVRERDGLRRSAGVGAPRQP